MELKRQLRPTIMKTNARHRGPTSALDYTNMVNESVHDLILLGKVIDGEPGTPGQSDHIYNNFAKYVNGSELPAHSNVASSTHLFKKGEALVKNGEPLQSLKGWTTFGECRIEQKEKAVRLTSTGKAKPSGIRIDIDVESGDAIFIRLGVTNVSGFPAGHTLLIGSRNMNNMEYFYQYALPQSGTIGYVDVTMDCLYRETASIDIFLLNDDSKLVGGSIDVSECEVRNLVHSELNLIPVNLDVKSRINVLGSEIQNLSR